MISTFASSVSTNLTKTAYGPTTALISTKNCGEREKETPLLFGKTKLQIWRNNKVLAPYVSGFRAVSGDWFKIHEKVIKKKKPGEDKIIFLTHIQNYNCYNSVTSQFNWKVNFIYLFNGIRCYEVGYFAYETACYISYDIFRDPTWLGQGEKKEAFFKEMFTENNVFLFYKCFNEGFSHWERTLNY